VSNELVQLRQGTGGRINVQHDVDGVTLAGITAAEYQMFNREEEVVLTLELGSGISWDGEFVVITITKQQAAMLVGFYSHECAAIDLTGRDLIVLDGQIQFKPRKGRNKL
jgi:hypothetical protein